MLEETLGKYFQKAPNIFLLLKRFPINKLQWNTAWSLFVDTGFTNFGSLTFKKEKALSPLMHSPLILPGHRSDQSKSTDTTLLTLKKPDATGKLAQTSFESTGFDSNSPPIP